METLNNEHYGRVIAPGVIRFKRILPGPIQRVWAYLTQSEKRAKWLASGQTELKPGGRVNFHFNHQELSDSDTPTPEKYKDMQNGHSFSGEVIETDPPHLLTYTWGEPSDGVSEVRFELVEKGDQVELTLTHRKLAKKEMVSVGSGWHTHLGILVDVLENKAPKGFWEVCEVVEKEYQNRLKETG